MTYAGMFAWRWRATTNLGRAANRAMRDLNHRLAAGPQASPARRQVSASTLRVPPPSKTRMRPKAAHEHACFAGCTNMGLTGMVFVRGYSCAAKAAFVSRGLPRTEGWNGAAAFDEGRWRRNVKWKPNRLQFDLQVKTATRHSSGKAARQAAAFRGRAQRKSNLPAHMEQYMWNRGDADKSRFRA